MSQREMLDLADRCIKSHVITEFPSVYSAPDVKECKSAAGSGVHLCSKFPHSQLLFSTFVYRAKFSEAGGRPWLSILMWIYMFLYLPGKCLLELNNSYLWGCYLSTLNFQYWKQPCSAFKHNIFSLEPELSFQISIWRYIIGFSSLLRPPGHCGNNNHNHSNTKQKTCSHEELQGSVSSAIWGRGRALLGHAMCSSGKEALVWNHNYYFKILFSLV